MRLFLREIIQERKISVNQLHKLTGISRTTLDPLCKEEFLPSKTKIDTLERISEKLKIPLSRMISFEDNQKMNDFEILGVHFILHEYSAPEREFADALALRVKGPKNEDYSILLRVNYALDNTFYEENKAYFERIDHLTSTDLSEQLSELQIEDEFENLYSRLEEKAKVFEGTLIFDKGSIRVFSLNDKKTWLKRYISDLSIFDFSNDFGKIVADDRFIELISMFVSDHYNLKEQLSKIPPSIDDSEYFDLTEEERYTPREVDYFSFVFTHKTESVEKSVYLKFKV